MSPTHCSSSRSARPSNDKLRNNMDAAEYKHVVLALNQTLKEIQSCLTHVGTEGYGNDLARCLSQQGARVLGDVENLDEAIAIAGRLPPAKKGTVEIRPLFPLPIRDGSTINKTSAW